MIPRDRWLPHPLLSAALLIVWLLLVNRIDIAQTVLGAVLALGVPLITRGFWPRAVQVRRPGLVALLALHLLGDIVVANLKVARRILGSTRALRPAFVVVPLELTNPYAVTVLANVISLTPGTVSADLGLDRTFLVVHALDVDDPHTVVDEIKRRYEYPLKEIFSC
ncbi:MAG: Na+/H+ antiporter subunit E [Gammaproteobacteria bacterium]|nr:Na+/H+ antiporter subunit E [Gammaproteobacteria bacterium]NIR96988.1 Na+/H+ antiporter subunit E [Gammaproteobacteria bacterium]NIT62690.1 Na+/H+ antiporter subunit E [Gammaproteobacteria bacterium]NIV19650.1 Na+/H+ antiporter subunit E [Gammaproteobacteria bacterium]NIX10870.1 Na+/H+ antiporter subunit E [Gammaproteobacteria bacterium]